MPFSPPIWFDILDSTNTVLKQMVVDNSQLPSGTVLATHYQTNGRGRLSRQWQSASGENLTFSALLRTNIDSIALPSLPLVIGVALVNALETYNMHAQLKWPNDVLVDHKKIAGVLVELLPSPDGKMANCIIGIGFNINMSLDSAKVINQPTTSLLIELNQTYAVQLVLDNLLIHLDKAITLWEEKGFAAIKPNWLKHAVSLNTQVTINNTINDTTTGIHRGIGPSGEIILEALDGTITTHFCGDLSL